MDTDIRKLLFLINGKSRNVKKINKQISKASLPDYDIFITEKAKTANKIIEEKCGEYSHIIAVGGDGTVHEVVNGLMKASGERNMPVLSVIPAGTANDFSKSLKFPANIKELSSALKKDKVKAIDIGEITFTDNSGAEQKAWFNNIADAGIGASVVQEVNRQSGKINANIAFFKAIIKSFRRYKNQQVHCETTEWSWEGKVKMFVIAKGKYFGSGLCIAPHAENDDGEFAITIGADISTIDYIKNLPLLKRGRKVAHPQMFYKKAKEVILTSAGPCAIEADGELLGFTPATVKLLPKRLNVLVMK